MASLACMEWIWSDRSVNILDSCQKFVQGLVYIFYIVLSFSNAMLFLTAMVVVYSKPPFFESLGATPPVFLLPKCCNFGQLLERR